MARGKVQLRRIENPVHRQVTFCKRRAGLLKKARELSVLCDADIGIIIFSAHGKLYDLATTGTMEELIERYKSASGEQANACGDQRMDPKQEAMVLKQEINLLQKGLRYIYGNRGNEHMTVEELNALERYLEIWMYNIRSAKVIHTESSYFTKKKRVVEFAKIFNLTDADNDPRDPSTQEQGKSYSLEGMLKAANEILQEKIVEQNGLIDVGMMVADQQNGHFSKVPLIEEITNPLTILSGYSTCRGSEMGYSF
uniref:MADS-box domain-containing protein n=1 Tax=Leersia perrieri TaxID=77586 RepID=A0A0D9X3S1_9ORYZ